MSCDIINRLYSWYMNSSNVRNQRFYLSLLTQSVVQDLKGGGGKLITTIPTLYWHVVPRSRKSEEQNRSQNVKSRKKLR